MAGMKRAQRLALLFGAANLALLLLFPPYDYISLQRSNTPTFDGFYFLLGDHPNRVLNQPFLTLEAIVVLINAAIAWVLLGSDRPSRRQGERYQHGVLALVAVNLLLMLLFPPFEYYFAVAPGAPTFDGFYFVFGDNTQRRIVTSVLYIEVTLVLVNGGLLWLLFEDRRR